MNARQKAKLYKQQLKRLTVPVNEIRIDRTQLKHSRIDIKIPTSFDSKFNEDEIKKVVKNRVLDELDDIIYNNIIKTEDPYYKEFHNYEFNIWTMN